MGFTERATIKINEKINIEILGEDGTAYADIIVNKKYFYDEKYEPFQRGIAINYVEGKGWIISDDNLKWDTTEEAKNKIMEDFEEVKKIVEKLEKEKTKSGE